MTAHRLQYGLLVFLLCGTAWAGSVPPFAVSPDATADKPQSKCWYHDGSWWAILSDGVDGARFYRLGRDSTWSALVFEDALVAPGSGVRVDVVSNGDRLTVLAWDEITPTLHKYVYESASGFYRRAAPSPGSPLLPPPPPSVPSVPVGVLPGLPGVPVAPGVLGAPVGFLPPAPGSLPGPAAPLGLYPALPPVPPVAVAIPVGHETATLALDTRGRAWVTAVVDGDVLVVRPGASGAPTVLASGLSGDDISAVASFAGRVGVFWSDQTTQSLSFRYRDDTAPPHAWRPTEPVVSGGHVADDHINFAVAADGALYVVTKTSVDDVPRPVDGPTQAPIILNARTPAGDWSTVDVAPVSEVFTSRPIVVLDEGRRVLYVVYRHGDEVVFRSSGADSMDSIDFSGAAEVALSVPGVTLRNVTSTKQAVDARSGLLVVATGSDGLAYSVVLPLSAGGP